MALSERSRDDLKGEKKTKLPLPKGFETQPEQQEKSHGHPRAPALNPDSFNSTTMEVLDRNSEFIIVVVVSDRGNSS